MELVGKISSKLLCSFLFAYFSPGGILVGPVHCLLERLTDIFGVVLEVSAVRPGGFCKINTKCSKNNIFKTQHLIHSLLD